MGIGKAAALALAREGARVAIVARGQEGLQAAAADIREVTGTSVVTLQTDCTIPAEVDRMMQEAAEALGGVQILINSIGAAKSGDFLTLTEADWVFSLESKLMGQVRVTRAAVPFMRARGFGRIVCVVGHRGWQPDPQALPAGVANAGLHNLIKGLGIALAADNILVNGISPAPMETRRLDYLIQERARLEGTTPEVARDAFLQEIPIGRFATPDDVAPLICLLASPLNSYITGTVVAIDGGATRGI